MIGCNEFMTELGSLLDDEVAKEIREQLELHLAHCRTCQVLYDSTRKTLQIVTESGTFEYPEPIEEPLVEKIMSRIRASCETDQRSRSD